MPNDDKHEKVKMTLLKMNNSSMSLDHFYDFFVTDLNEKIDENLLNIMIEKHYNSIIEKGISIILKK